MIDRRWLFLVLGISIIASGLFFAMWMRERSRAGIPEVSAIELEESATTGTGAPTGLPLPTTTRKPQPSVVQVTRLVSTIFPTPTLTETPLPTATALPTQQPSPMPPVPPSPTATPEPEASPTLEAVGTDWLQFVNLFRREANLPPLVENTIWSNDSAAHSRYMVYTGDLSHHQDPASPYASQSGQTAAENGNIAAGYLLSDPFEWAINYWMSAPFHAIPILDPQLQATGFAEYRDANGAQPLTATMDVTRGLGPLPDGVSFPVLYPRDGGLTWVLRYSLPEFPEALSTCPGYAQPTGAPIILQVGQGNVTPQVTATSLFKDGEYLAHCRFDETTFIHPNEFRQKSAREILNQRDAIVIIPQQPLLPDKTYAVRVDVNGQIYTWSFRTAAGPP